MDLSVGHSHWIDAQNVSEASSIGWIISCLLANELAAVCDPRLTCYHGDTFLNEAAITRLVGAILLEQNDEWAVQRARYITLESIAPIGDDPGVGLPIAAH